MELDGSLFGGVALGAAFALGAGWYLWGRTASALQQRALDAEDRYGLLTQHLAASVIVRDPDMRALFVSPYTEILTGFPAAQFTTTIPDLFDSRVHPEDKALYDRAYQVTKTGEPFQVRYRLLHATDVEVWVESRTVPILGDSGEVIASLTITFDVSRAVLSQQQVEEKSREVEDFTSMVSHDLKSPLFTLKGMVQLLEEERSRMPPSALEPLDHLSRNVERLTQLVTSILDYSRTVSRQHKSTAVELDTVLREVLLDFAPAIKAADAEVQIDEELGTVLGDDLAMTQIFSNIISNAIKYRHPERRLKIRIVHELAPSLKLTRLSIKDNGRGISADNLVLLFRPFQRFHPADVEGSGIGLASVRKLITRMGGEIVATSDGESGTTFTITLRRPS
jgi:signal transduction histidine kinase